MELKNCNAKTSEEVAIEISTNKVEEVDNIMLEILHNSCVEIFPTFGIDSANEA